MYKERFGFAVQHFAVSHMLLVALFWLIRLFEFFSLAALHLFARSEIPVILGLIFDAWFCFVLALILFPVYIILYVLIGPITRFFLGLVFVFYVLVYLGLVSYFIITQVPLGVDFWGYSMEDILAALSVTKNISVVVFLPMILIVGLLLFYYPRAQEVILPGWVLIVYYNATISLGIIYFIKTPEKNGFTNESRYTVSINKMAYFGEKTVEWYWEKNSGADSLMQEVQFDMEAGKSDSMPEQAISSEFVFSSDERIIIQRLGLDTLNPDQLFVLAQQKARQNDYKKARILCKKALLSSPNYTDIRLLFGRTFYWEGKYERARKIFEQCRKRDPNNKEVWMAMIENEVRATNYDEGIHLANKAYGKFKDTGFIMLREKAMELKAASNINE